MAKISKRISPEDENKEPQKQEQYSGGIKRTVNTPETPVNDGMEVDTHTPNNNTSREKPLSPEEIVNWFISFFGEDMFTHIKENPNFNLPFTEDEISTEEWLNKALKTVFLFEDIQIMGSILKEKYFNVVTTVEESKEFKKQYKVLKTELEELNEDYDRSRSKRNKLEKELSASVPVEGIVDAIFSAEEKTVSIGNALKDAMSNPSDELKDFIASFIKGWLSFKNTLQKLGSNEKENIDIAQNGAKDLLQNISGQFIPERRAMLDLVAEYISTFFEEFIFISPEQSLQLDPNIHNAKGLGGSRVKEGVSFAVLRKENKQTYQYADIKVQ